MNARVFYLYNLEYNEAETWHSGFVDNVFKSQKIAPISHGEIGQDDNTNKSFTQNLSTRIENNSTPNYGLGSKDTDDPGGRSQFDIVQPTQRNANKIVYMRSSHPTRGNIFRGIHNKYRLPSKYTGVIGKICKNPVNIPVYQITLNGISVTLTASNPLKLYKVNDNLYVIRVPLLNRQDFEISVREEFGQSEDPANYEHQSFLLNDFTTSGFAVDDCYWLRSGNILTSATNPNVTFNIGTWTEPTTIDDVLEIHRTSKDECTYTRTDESPKTYKYMYTNNSLYIYDKDIQKPVRTFNFLGLDGELYDVVSDGLMVPQTLWGIVLNSHAVNWYEERNIYTNENLGTMVKNFLSSYLLNLVVPPHTSGVDNVGVNFFYYFLLVGSVIATAGGGGAGAGGGARAGATRIPATPIGSGRVPFPRDPKVGVKPPPAPPTQIPATPIGSGRTYTGSFRGTESVVPKQGAGNGSALQAVNGGNVRSSPYGPGGIGSKTVDGSKHTQQAKPLIEYYNSLPKS
jgi:hypothetical protein